MTSTNLFANQREWLLRKYDGCLTDLGFIERNITDLMEFEFESERTTALTNSLQQAAGVWRQMAHIAELLSWTDDNGPPLQATHATFREWRAEQLERLDRIAGRRKPIYALEIDDAA